MAGAIYAKCLYFKAIEAPLEDRMPLKKETSSSHSCDLEMPGYFNDSISMWQGNATECLVLENRT